MAAVATNLISGPATLWDANFGATEPADTAVETEPTSPFSDLGGTDDGVSLNVEREFFELRMDQVTMTPSRRRTKLDVMVVTNLAEPTLENLALVLGQPSADVVSGGTGPTANKTLDFDVMESGAEPNWRCTLLRGRAPNGKRRNVYIRKSLSIESAEIPYKKGDQTLIPVTFAAHYISNAIKPVHCVDGAAV